MIRSTTQLIPLLCFLFLLSKPMVAQAAGPTLRIATWNLEWFNDHDRSDDRSTIGRDFAAPNFREYAERVTTTAAAIAEMKPTILALQEVENRKVVIDLANELADQHNLDYEVAFEEGKDSFTGQDVAFLVEAGLLFEASRYRFPNAFRSKGYKDISKHLKLEAIIADEAFTLVTVHLITSDDNREKQALTLRGWIENTVATDNLIILGDFNARQRFNQTRPNSEMGIIRGFQTDTQKDDLFDVHQWLGQRETHVSGAELDRILVSPRLLDEDGFQVIEATVRRDLAILGREDRSDGVDYDQPADEQDISDHFPVLITLRDPSAAADSDPSQPTIPEDEAATQPESLRQELLTALAKVEAEIAQLNARLEEIRQLIEALE